MTFLLSARVASTPTTGRWLTRVTLLLFSPLLFAAVPEPREEFQAPGNGENFGVWRITHDPTARHWANYHNTRCWSPDGRYLCYTKYAEGKTADEVFVYDAQSDSTRNLGHGLHPR